MSAEHRFPAPLRLAIPPAGADPREHQRLTTEAIRELAAAYNSLADDLVKVVTEVIVVGNEVRNHGTMLATVLQCVTPMRPVADSIADPIEEAARGLSERARNKRDPMTSERARAIVAEVTEKIAEGAELKTWRLLKGLPIGFAATAAKEGAKVLATLGIAYAVAHLARLISW